MTMIGFTRSFVLLVASAIVSVVARSDEATPSSTAEHDEHRDGTTQHVLQTHKSDRKRIKISVELVAAQPQPEGNGKRRASEISGDLTDPKAKFTGFNIGNGIFTFHPPKQRKVDQPTNGDSTDPKAKFTGLNIGNGYFRMFKRDPDEGGAKSQQDEQTLQVTQALALVDLDGDRAPATAPTVQQRQRKRHLVASRADRRRYKMPRRCQVVARNADCPQKIQWYRMCEDLQEPVKRPYVNQPFRRPRIVHVAAEDAHVPQDIRPCKSERHPVALLGGTCTRVADASLSTDEGQIPRRNRRNATTCVRICTIPRSIRVGDGFAEYVEEKNIISDLENRQVHVFDSKINFVLTEILIFY